MFWVISVQFDLRNTLPKLGPFLLGHPVYVSHLLVWIINRTRCTVHAPKKCTKNVDKTNFGVYGKKVNVERPKEENTTKEGGRE